jgi:transcriptional regulator with XRE-family HTH domain
MEESVFMKKRAASTPEGARAIGARLSSLRKAKGLTQIDVAAALDITQTLISKYERGDLLMHGELIAQFAAVLGVSADDILGIESKRSKPALPAVDKTLARRLAQLQALPRRDRDALLRTLDAFLAKSSKAA